MSKKGSRRQLDFSESIYDLCQDSYSHITSPKV